MAGSTNKANTDYDFDGMYLYCSSRNGTCLCVEYKNFGSPPLGAETRSMPGATIAKPPALT